MVVDWPDPASSSWVNSLTEHRHHLSLILWLVIFGPILSGEKPKNHRMKPAHTLVGIGTGLICMLLIVGLSILFEKQIFDLGHLHEQLKMWDFTGRKVFIFILVLIFVNPFLEEWYWRKFIYDRLIEKMSAFSTILVTSFFYALYHLFLVITLFAFPYSIIAFIGVLLAGLLWGGIRYYCQSIYPTIISHCLADIGIIVVYVLVVLGGVAIP